MKDKCLQAADLLKEWVEENPDKRTVILTAMDMESGMCLAVLRGSVRNAAIGVLAGTRKEKALREAYKFIGLSLLDYDGELQDLAGSRLKKSDIPMPDKKMS